MVLSNASVVGLLDGYIVISFIQLVTTNYSTYLGICYHTSLVCHSFEGQNIGTPATELPDFFAVSISKT